jgi:hypothetical protein
MQHKPFLRVNKVNGLVGEISMADLLGFLLAYIENSLPYFLTSGELQRLSGTDDTLVVWFPSFLRAFYSKWSGFSYDN